MEFCDALINHFRNMKKLGWNFSKLAPHALAEGESTEAVGSMPGQATIS